MNQVSENLIYCLNATVPIFLLMLLGMFFRKIKLFDGNFAGKLNAFVFKVGLPVMLFKDLAGSDFFSVWDGSFVLFCLLSTLASILITVALSLLLKERPLRGEFIQGSYRSSIALLGAAFLENLYGNAGATSLVIIGAVPLYNIAAVTALTFTSPSLGRMDGKAVRKALKGIVTNPIILGIVIGLVWSLLDIPRPAMFQKAVNSVSATATPLGLMALGASFDLKQALGRWKATFAATFLKLVGFGAIFIPIAIALGFREAKLVSVLAMLTGPATVSGFVMARNLGHEGTLSAGIIMLTTLLSAFTLTLWLYILKTLGLI